MSYQVLEQWAALWIGAAILPNSKVTARKGLSFPIVDKSDLGVMIRPEASWPRSGGTPSSHLLDFSNHLRKVVPKIVSGLQLNL